MRQMCIIAEHCFLAAFLKASSANLITNEQMDSAGWIGADVMVQEGFFSPNKGPKPALKRLILTASEPVSSALKVHTYGLHGNFYKIRTSNWRDIAHSSTQNIKYNSTVVPMGHYGHPSLLRNGSEKPGYLIELPVSRKIFCRLVRLISASLDPDHGPDPKSITPTCPI